LEPMRLPTSHHDIKQTHSVTVVTLDSY
jgi:hypothetical protein